MYNLKKALLNQSKYISGYVNENDDYVISASMVGREPLQNYLDIIYGKQEVDDITDMFIGSCFHEGMRTYMNKEANYDKSIIGVEKPLHTKLSNGWIISGTADLIVTDNDTVEIHDYKTTKAYAVKMFDKEPLSHQYNMQLNVLGYLWKQMHPSFEGEIKLVLDFFVKDADKLKSEPTLVQREVQQLTNKEIEETLLQKTNELQSYIESGQIPPKCEQLWPRKVNGVFMNSRCEIWCQFKRICPHYESPYNKDTAMLTNF